MAFRSEVRELVGACRQAGINPAVGDRIYTCKLIQNQHIV